MGEAVGLALADSAELRTAAPNHFVIAELIFGPRDQPELIGSIAVAE
jgi:hypothetical protein